MSGVLSDLKYAVHTLAKQPAFSLMIVGMLGLGIAGNTAIFSLFNGLFLRPLPFSEPDRLVNLDETAPQWDLEYVGIAYPDFHAWREENRSFDAMAVFRTQGLNLFLKGDARRIKAAQVTYDLASVLEINPILGRNFTPEEDQRGGPKVALLGFGLWQAQFGGDPSVLGEKILLDSEPYTIIGVLPTEALFIGDADLWVPLATDVDQFPTRWYLQGIGRLKDTATLDQAREDLNRIHKNRIESRPQNKITSPVMIPVLDRYLGEYRAGTTALLAAVGVVLLIACANITGLMLARSSQRAKEIGIRIALGAARKRIVQQLLTESLVLSALGAILGTLLGFSALRALVSMMPETIPRWIHFDLDVRFLLFTLLVTLGATVLVGLAPALQASKADVNQALQLAGVRSSATAGKRRSFNVLVVSEIALALVLLIAAGLLITGFRELQKVDPGFRPHNVLAYQIQLPLAKYREPERRIGFLQEHLERIRTLPGVEAVGASSYAPLGGHDGYFFEAEGAPPLGPDEKNPVVLNRSVTPGYFHTLGVDLLKGRVFNSSDGREEGNRVVIVNETFAKRFFPGGDPIGKRIRNAGGDAPWMRVIGMTKDVKHYGLDVEMRPGVYVPYFQTTRPYMTVVVRTLVDPLSLVAPARQALRELDAEIPLYQTTTMSKKIGESIWPRRAASWLFAAFAAVALILASAGLYGVISYSVSQRTQEISIRMALGARPGQVLHQVMKQGVLLIGLGAALGLTGAFALARTLSSLLFNVGPTDLGVYTVVTVILVGIALTANLLPARRAANIDPMEALRTE